MKVKVLKDFHDKDNYATVYPVNSVMEVEQARYQELRALGLVVEVKERPQKTKTNR